MEIFKPFPLNPLVKVGNLGTIIRPNGKTAKQSNHSVGYLQLGIMINNEIKIMKAHIVVAMAWIDNPNQLPEVNHLDGNKKNNVVSNLVWSTHRDNIIHAWGAGLSKPNKGRTGIKHTPCYIPKGIY